MQGHVSTCQQGERRHGLPQPLRFAAVTLSAVGHVVFVVFVPGKEISEKLKMCGVRACARLTKLNVSSRAGFGMDMCT